MSAMATPEPSPAVAAPPRTAEDFARAAREHGITEWRIGSCPACGYRTGYLFEGSLVFSDSGCWCDKREPSPRDWFDVATHYRLSADRPAVRARYDRFWRWSS